jgi:creatinine amidohydrolase
LAKELKNKYKDSKIIKANYFLFEGYNKVISKNELLHGYHGGEFETSLMLYLANNLVRKNKIKKNKLSPDYNNKKLIGFEKNVKLQWNTEDINKTGIIGNPKNANSQKGKEITNIATSTIKKIIKELKLL